MKASRRLCAGGPVRRNCGAHGGHETAEVRDAWRTGRGRGLRERSGKKSRWGVSWTTSELAVSMPISRRPRKFRYQRRSVDDCSPGRGRMAQDSGTIKGRIISWRNGSLQRKSGLDYGNAVVCPNVMGRTKERIAQSKRAHAGRLAIFDMSYMARICILRAFMSADVIFSFSGVTFFYFCFVSFSSLLWFHGIRGSMLNRPSIRLRLDSHTHLANNYGCVLLVLFLYFFVYLGRCRFFRVFCTITISFLYEKYKYLVSFSPGWCFSILWPRNGF